jgi:hypothetical protein
MAGQPAAQSEAPVSAPVEPVVKERMTRRWVIGGVLATTVVAGAFARVEYILRKPHEQKVYTVRPPALEPYDYTMGLPTCRSGEDTFRIEAPDAETLVVFRCSSTGRWVLTPSSAAR